MLQILIDSCTFTQNYGLNIAYGAAVSVDGMQGKTFKEKYVLHNFGLISLLLQAAGTGFSFNNDFYMKDFKHGLTNEFIQQSFAQRI